MVYNVHSSVTRSTVIFFSRSFFAYLPNRIIKSGKCHNSLNFCTRLQLFGSADSVCVSFPPLLNRYLSLSNGFIALPRTAKICDCCSQPLCSYSAALLEAILQRCNSVARFVRLLSRSSTAAKGHHNFHQHTCKLTNKKNSSHEEVPEVESCHPMIYTQQHENSL